MHSWRELRKGACSGSVGTLPGQETTLWVLAKQPPAALLLDPVRRRPPSRQSLSRPDIPLCLLCPALPRSATTYHAVSACCTQDCGQTWLLLAPPPPALAAWAWYWD